jgi:predicted tellurium resistance membrane protein TerC
MGGSGQLPNRGSGPRSAAPVITTARTGATAEMNSRVRRYTITMAFRTACFLAMIWVPGVFRWILFACALFLPYVAVIFANQSNRRSDSRWASIEGPEGSEGHRELGTGATEEETGDEVIDAEPTDEPRQGSTGRTQTNGSRPDDRVA